MIGTEFSRASFERSGCPEDVAKRLSEHLTYRLRSSPNRRAQIADTVEDLRRLGHPIFNWDETEWYSAWGDSWVEPPSGKRLLVEFLLLGADDDGADNEPVVRVTFGDWPRESTTQE